MISISVVVCTYNRARLLDQALETLCHQSLAASKYEILVVDNNSTDNTRVVAERCSARYPNVRYLFEPNLGVSHARNRGWKEAHGEYVGYIDDDCKAPPEFLGTASNIIRDHSPDAFGGQTRPFYATSKPAWFLDKYETWTHGSIARLLKTDEFIFGNNMFIRRELFKVVGGFDPTFGPHGERQGYGDEDEWLARAREVVPNLFVYFDPRLYVLQVVRPQKMNLIWLAERALLMGRYSYRRSNRSRKVSLPNAMASLGTMLLTTGILGLEILIGSLVRSRRNYPYVQNYLYERPISHIWRVGALWEQFVTAFGQYRSKGSTQDK